MDSYRITVELLLDRLCIRLQKLQDGNKRLPWVTINDCLFDLSEMTVLANVLKLAESGQLDDTKINRSEVWTQQKK